MAEQPTTKKQKKLEKMRTPFASGVSDLINLLNGISHGNKEVFLRELVFNASQALYKMGLAALNDDPRGLFIDIIPDKSNHTLSIVDNGIGMTEDDLRKLFTIPEPAPERHKEAARRLENNTVVVDEFYKLDSDFHLGFFAAFMVADEVQITTKPHGTDDDPFRLFASARNMSFFIVGGDWSSDTTRSCTPRGTTVTLHLKKDQFEYLDEGSLKGLIDKYLFDLLVPYPISIIVQSLAHVEEKKKDMEKLTSQSEGLRKPFVEGFSGRNADFKHALIADRMHDLPAFVSLDRATIEINPRNSLITGLYSSGGDSRALERKSHARSRKRIIIPTDNYGKLIGGVDSLKLFSFLDTIARDGHKAPLNYSGWRAMPEGIKENLWKEIQENFYFDHPNSKIFIMRYLMVSWNTWRYTLKRKRYLTCATDVERLANLDERVLPCQWEYLVSYWNTEHAKATAAGKNLRPV